MRRFALTNLRDYGMGKKACEDKIIEECHHLMEVFKTFKGKRLFLIQLLINIFGSAVHNLNVFSVSGQSFDTTQPMNYAVSNIICSMVYGSRFEYDDPEFTSMVDRTNRNFELAGSPSIQVSFNKA